MDERQAECSCGQLRVRCAGELVRISVCHCLACQRRTGSPFAQQARWPNDRVAIEGTATTFTRTGDDGGTLTFHFCPTCGATVHYEIDAMPGVTAIPVGAFAEPRFPGPTVSVYEARKHDWVTVPDCAEHVE